MKDIIDRGYEESSIKKRGSASGGAGGALSTNHDVIRISFHIDYSTLIVFLKSVDQ
jgi:hypothetical protein